MFEGADVSGLDKMAHEAQEGAEYAETILVALRILVAALKAMSWTGWAAAFAAYLEATVIPWVKATKQALERFAKVLRAASALQKSVSGDSPQVAIPASAYVSPQMPANTAVHAPSLSSPEYAINGSSMPTTATGAGGPVATPTGVGSTASSLGQTGAIGGGSNTVSPGETVTVSVDFGPTGTVGGGSAVGPGSTPTPTWTDPGGSASGVSAAGAGIGTVDPSPTGGSGASSGGSIDLGSTGIGGDSADSAAGSDAGGAGSIGSGPTESGSAGSGSTGSGSLGSGSAGSGSLGSGSAGSGSLGGHSAGASGSTGTAGGDSTASGDPRVLHTPVSAQAGSLGTAGAASGGLGGVPQHDDAGGPNNAARIAMAAAPIGLAGAGAATLGALRRKGTLAEADTDDAIDDGDTEDQPLGLDFRSSL